MTTVALRLLLAGWIGLMLLRAGRAAWRQRTLVRTVWRSIRWRHLAGSVALLALVATVATTLIARVPGMAWGLGNVLGTTGNAVFIPLEEAAARAGTAPASGPDWILIAISTVFLGGLAALLPWLAFVEEEVFRAGLEDASLGREVATALVFGLAHLTMLVPIGAALAIAVAGFLYGRAYRAAHQRPGEVAVPGAVLAAYRPTRRATAAMTRTRLRRATVAVGTAGTAGPTLEVPEDPRRRQAAAVLSATVWHATFNTTVVTIVWLAIVVSAVAPAAAR